MRHPGWRRSWTPTPARGNAGRSVSVAEAGRGGRRDGSRLVVVRAQRLAVPVLRFDGFDLVLAEPEVVADFVNQRLADHGAHLVFVFGIFLDRALENRDPIRQRVAV